MPFVTIRITADNTSAEKKERVIKGVTDVLVKELGKNPASCMIVIEEYPVENWGMGGESVRTIRERRKTQG